MSVVQDSAFPLASTPRAYCPGGHSLPSAAKELAVGTVPNELSSTSVPSIQSEQTKSFAVIEITKGAKQ